MGVIPRCVRRRPCSAVCGVLVLACYALYRHYRSTHCPGDAGTRPATRLGMSGGVVELGRGIPKMLHQSYKGSCSWPSPQWSEWSEGCRAANLGWQWVFWSDDDNKRLFDSPELIRFRGTYRAISNPVARADFSRFGYLYMHGGAYLDLDIQCHRPIEALLEAYTTQAGGMARVIIGSMGMEPDLPGWYGGNRVPNAIMLSEAGHPLWLHCMELASRALQAGSASKDRPVSVEAVAGPVLLEKCLSDVAGRVLFDANYSHVGEIAVDAPRAAEEAGADEIDHRLRADIASYHGIFLASKEHTYPYDWRDGAFSPCRDKYFEARSRGVGAAEAEAAFLSCYPVAGVSGESVFSTMWTHRWKASVQHG